MGERSNVYITVDEDQPPLVIYSHWGGGTLAPEVHSAILKAEERWGDPSYCCRIIVQNFLNRIADPESSTGAGLSFRPDDQDSYYNPIHVSIPKQEVRIGNGGWSFKEFVDMDPLRTASMERR